MSDITMFTVVALLCSTVFMKVLSHSVYPVVEVVLVGATGLVLAILKTFRLSTKSLLQFWGW